MKRRKRIRKRNEDEVKKLNGRKGRSMRRRMRKNKKSKRKKNML